jgi:hypothetical protein
VSHLRHEILNGFNVSSGGADAVANATTSDPNVGIQRSELSGDQLDEGGDHAVEPVVQGDVLLHNAADRCDLQTRERLTR